MSCFSGEKISVKHSTLCLGKDSVLTKQFNDEEWLNTHKSKDKHSGDVIITEQPDYFFNKMISSLRLRAILESGCKLPSISKKKIEEQKLFHKFVSNIFPGNEILILCDRLKYDSLILKTSEEMNTILSWLPSVHKSSKPSLLYRATRDGWDASVFHSKCDNRESTIIVIETDKVYVFGGYLDKGWKIGDWITSNACHANVPPTKMSFRKSAYAARGISIYGPNFGE